jgi:hypothetical protein
LLETGGRRGDRSLTSWSRLGDPVEDLLSFARTQSEPESLTILRRWELPDNDLPAEELAGVVDGVGECILGARDAVAGQTRGARRRIVEATPLGVRVDDALQVVSGFIRAVVMARVWIAPRSCLRAVPLGAVPGVRSRPVTVHSTEEARIRARIAAHARRLFVKGKYRSALALSRALHIDHAQVWRVLTGQKTPGLRFLIALHRRLGADLNVIPTKDPPRRWFKPMRPAFEWEEQ